MILSLLGPTAPTSEEDAEPPQELPLAPTVVPAAASEPKGPGWEPVVSVIQLWIQPMDTGTYLKGPTAKFLWTTRCMIERLRGLPLWGTFLA